MPSPTAILRLSSVGYVFDNPLNIAALPAVLERAGIKPVRIELFDFLPFHADPLKLARVQLRITMIARARARARADCDAQRHARTHARSRIHTFGYCYRIVAGIAIDNDLIVYCGNYARR